ncbi:DnaJ domain-containing protein [Verticillium alfalfae VaMs.102]|uniref:DnaJ domain-containing protein n=1 Tax=Verticillium alfalfae (strain VaMs.102 / ATCC MYA-4576 / FGSC 10136) TaxID=526221 RepID=C9SXQ2_VERA1|nr:DnaJ domain-containing protein [Verticillium alfalfae VaMs.102]EEY23567.1 DnaJ domain-containing protein [Verticillium alfalfae VaMs.102]
MGAQQSSDRHEEQSGGGLAVAKICYYELLGVDREATDEEIKKSYRRKALELHPDRNYDDVENATRRFAEIQSAYEVLSDPQERAWYDSHREAILRGAEADDYDHPPEFNNVRLTSTEDILSLIRRFNSTVPFTDDPMGFYGILNETFAHLADEEDAVRDSNSVHRVDYPSFGESSDEYEPNVKAFYANWAGFSTVKTFAWKDKYRLSDAPDRRVRRAMEKENKKMRDDAIKEFNDAVRFLVTFARKRDPRYLPNSQTDAERQSALRNAAAAQAARSRAANMEKLADDHLVPEWAQSRQDDADAGSFTQSEEESEVEHIECVVWDGGDQMVHSGDEEVRSVDGLDVHDVQTHLHVAGGGESKTAVLSTDGDYVDNVSNTDDDDGDDDDDDEYASRAVVEGRIAGVGDTKDGLDGNYILNTDKGSGFSVDERNHLDIPAKKPGKAKAKREKKAAREAAAQLEEPQHLCGVCHETFPSKTKLSSHIRDEDHAAPKTTGIPNTKTRKKKR